MVSGAAVNPGSGMGRLDLDLLSSIIDDIYDCVLNPEGWTAALARVTTAVDAAYVSLSLANAVNSQHRMAAQSPWDPAQLRALVEDYPPDEVPGLLPVLAGDVDLPQSTLSCMSEAEFHASPFYQNWVKPQGLREACLTKFVHTPDRLGIMACTIRADRDIITGEERHFLTLLSPHMRRAALISDLLDHARIMTSLYRSALDNLATPVVFTNADGSILYTNAGAEQMLSARGSLYSKAGAIHAQNPIVAQALLAAIASASGADLSIGARGIGLPISAPGEPPAVAYVLPLREGTARAAFRPACAAIFVSTTTSASPLPEAVLTALFDLTPAEARVLLHIGGGMSASKTVQSLGIKEDTLKTHLGRIFSKTNTMRQADLVKLVNDIGTPLALQTMRQA
jgi:DNA-binding CsgD family transcriptional regulator/PAS domain-containing protein